MSEELDALRGEILLWHAAGVSPSIDPQDASELQCHLIWWPNELPIPLFGGDTPDRHIAGWSFPSGAVPRVTENEDK